MGYPYWNYYIMNGERVLLRALISECTLYIDAAANFTKKFMIPPIYFPEYDHLERTFLFAYNPGDLLNRSSCNKIPKSLCIFEFNITYKAHPDELCYRFTGRLSYRAQSRFLNKTICVASKWAITYITSEDCPYDYMDRPNHELITVNNVPLHVLTLIWSCKLYVDVTTNEYYKPSLPAYKYFYELDPSWWATDGDGTHEVELQDKEICRILLNSNHSICFETRGVSYEARSKGICYKWKARISYDTYSKLINRTVCVGLSKMKFTFIFKGLLKAMFYTTNTLELPMLLLAERLPIYTTKNCSMRDSYPYDVYGFFVHLNITVKLEQRIVNCTFILSLSFKIYDEINDTLSFKPITRLKFSSDVASERHRFLTEVAQKSTHRPCSYPYPYGPYKICLNVFNISYKANETNNLCFKWIGDVTIRRRFESGNYNHHMFKPNETWICTTKRARCMGSDKNLFCPAAYFSTGDDGPKMLIFNDFIRCLNTIRIMLLPRTQPGTELLSRVINELNLTATPDIMFSSSLALHHHDFPRCKDYGRNEEICADVATYAREVNNLVCFKHIVKVIRVVHHQNGSADMLNAGRILMSECCTSKTDQEREET